MSPTIWFSPRHWPPPKSLIIGPSEPCPKNCTTQTHFRFANELNWKIRMYSGSHLLPHCILKMPLPSTAFGSSKCQINRNHSFKSHVLIFEWFENEFDTKRQLEASLEKKLKVLGLLLQLSQIKIHVCVSSLNV